MFVTSFSKDATFSGKPCWGLNGEGKTYVGSQKPLNPGGDEPATWVYRGVPSLKLTAKAPKNGWLEKKSFPIGEAGLFSGAFAVSFRECRFPRYFRLVAMSKNVFSNSCIAGRTDD